MTSKDTTFSIFTGGSITTPEGNKPDPEPATAEQWYLMTIKPPPPVKELIEAIRAEPDKDKRNELKKSLRFCSPAVLIKPGQARKTENIESRSGLIVMDIDNLTRDPELVKAKLKAAGIKPAIIFKSPSGGLKIFYRIDPEEGTHLEFFSAIMNYLKSEYGIDADPSGKDLCRACFLSYDPAAYYTENPDIIGRDFIEKYKSVPAPAGSITPDISTTDIHFKKGTRNDFTARIAGGLHRGGITQAETLETCLRFTEQGFPASEIEKIVRSIYSNGNFAGNPSFDPAAALEAYRIDPTTEVMEPPVLLWINEKIIATRGNFSMITGKAKSRKTFLVSCLVAEAAGGNSSIEGIEGNKQDIGSCLYFDTEQSEFHAQRSVKRICRQIGSDNPDNVLFYGLRPLEPAQRLQTIEKAMSLTPGLSLVVIDGIADLLSNGINDEAEAIKLTSYLLRWTSEFNIHIITILHQNKGDQNARGHIGTSLVNKAETVISVTKEPRDEKTSNVKADYCRDIDFPSFCFTIDDKGLPYLTDLGEATTSRKTEEMIDYMKACFPGMMTRGYNDLRQVYMERAGISVPTAQRHIAKCLELNVIKRDNAGNYSLNSIHDPEEAPF